MVDLEELEAKWAEHDRRLEANLRLSRRLLESTTLRPARSAIQRLTVLLVLEGAATLAGIVALGAFIYDNIFDARFVLPAAALDLMAIAMLRSLILQIAAAGRIDYSGPIATIQRQLAALRMMRIRYIQWTVMAGMIGWVLLLIVAMKGLLGVDAYRVLNGAWLVANLLFGLGVIAAALWLSRRYSDRMGRHPVIQRLMKELAGYNLKAAEGFLATLSDFEREERAG